MDEAREMTLNEWCRKLHKNHLVNKQLDEIITTLKHARLFIISREKMYEDGIKLYDELLTKISDNQAFNLTKAEGQVK